VETIHQNWRKENIMKMHSLRSRASACAVAVVVLTCAGEVSGEIINLGLLPGGGVSRAFGVSDDGSVVVGRATTPETWTAFCWTNAEGMQDLGTLPGGNWSRAFSASADGSVVVGVSGVSIGQHAFCWTSAGGMQDLGVLPGGSSSNSLGVSRDGSVVVGS